MQNRINREMSTRPTMIASRLRDAEQFAGGGDLIWVDLDMQRLWHLEGWRVKRMYRCSTAANGHGERDGSFCTPRGWHEVRELIGAGMPPGTVYRSRVPTGAIWTMNADGIDTAVEEDLILDRILRLAGLEDGLNCGPGRDSWDRYIYIHGTNHIDRLGEPASHGCVRMDGADVRELFASVKPGTAVFIN